ANFKVWGLKRLKMCGVAGTALRETEQKGGLGHPARCRRLKPPHRRLVRAELMQNSARKVLCRWILRARRQDLLRGFHGIFELPVAQQVVGLFNRDRLHTAAEQSERRHRQCLPYRISSS